MAVQGPCEDCRLGPPTVSEGVDCGVRGLRLRSADVVTALTAGEGVCERGRKLGERRWWVCEAAEDRPGPPGSLGDSDVPLDPATTPFGGVIAVAAGQVSRTISRGAASRNTDEGGGGEVGVFWRGSGQCEAGDSDDDDTGSCRLDGDEREGLCGSACVLADSKTDEVALRPEARTPFPSAAALSGGAVGGACVLSELLCFLATFTSTPAAVPRTFAPSSFPPRRGPSWFTGMTGLEELNTSRQVVPSLCLCGPPRSPLSSSSSSSSSSLLVMSVEAPLAECT